MNAKTILTAIICSKHHHQGKNTKFHYDIITRQRPRQVGVSQFSEPKLLANNVRFPI